MRKLVPASDISHGTAADCFRAASQVAVVSSLVDCVFTSPRDMYDIMVVVAPVLASVPESSPAFAAVVDFLVVLGKGVVLKVRCG